MALNKTTTFADDLLAYLGGTAMPAAPAQLWLAFHTGDPGEGGSMANEPASGTDYARQPITLGATADSADNPGVARQRANSATISFDALNVDVTPTHVTINRSGVRGTADALYHGALTAPDGSAFGTLSAGQPLVIDAGNLVIEEG